MSLGESLVTLKFADEKNSELVIEENVKKKKKKNASFRVTMRHLDTNITNSRFLTDLYRSTLKFSAEAKVLIN